MNWFWGSSTKNEEVKKEGEEGKKPILEEEFEKMKVANGSSSGHSGKVRATTASILSNKSGTTLYIQSNITLDTVPFNWTITTRSTVCVLANQRSSTDSNVRTYICVDGSGNVYMDTVPNHRSLFNRTYYSGTSDYSYNLFNTNLYLAIDASGNMITTTTLDAKARWSATADGSNYLLQNSSSSKNLLGDLDGITVLTQTLPGSHSIRFDWTVSFLYAVTISYTSSGSTYYLRANTDDSVQTTTTFSDGCTWLQVESETSVYGFRSMYGFWMMNNLFDNALMQSILTPYPSALSGDMAWTFV